MPDSLPYPGYSWPFTQHAIGLKPKIVYTLLTCASSFAGQERAGNKITSLIVSHGLLTPNIRAGRQQAWRDYQQILAELGLIYSTKIEKKLHLTEAALTLLSGEVGFSELMTIQALRYQYPNGQKSDMQARIKGELRAEGILPPETLIELQVNNGVLIKPGLLLLRILLELKFSKLDPTLSFNECLAFLLPIRQNRNWANAFPEIVKVKRTGHRLPSVNSHARRNIQDWFKFLEKTDVFSVLRDKIRLTPMVLERMDYWRDFCEMEERPESFWLPTGYSSNDKMKWFDFFGRIPFDLQSMTPIEEMGEQYVKENYIDGVLEDDYEKNINADVRSDPPTIKLKALSATRDYFGGVIKDPEEALVNLKNGSVKRMVATAIHDSIVMEIAEKLKKKGAEVFEDRDSVDLLAVWTKDEAVFEVKTANRRNFQGRLRQAIGQLFEYGYRRSRSKGTDPEKIIVVNMEVPEKAWQVDFVNHYTKIGLLCKTSDGFKGFAHPDSKTGKFWAKL